MKLLSPLVESPMGHQVLRALQRLEAQRPNQLLVLTYHAVESLESFETQMNYLAANYEIVGMMDVVDAVAARKRLPPAALLITFDDAYRNFAECAWPVLRRYGLPVTLFVPTAFPGPEGRTRAGTAGDAPGRIYWWDRLEHALLTTTRRSDLDTPVGRLPMATAGQRRAALRRLKQYMWDLPHTEILAWLHEISDRLAVTAPRSEVMGWDELRHLKSQGVTLAPHSRTHPKMSRITAEQAHAEVAGSLADLQRETGPVLPVFAYPGGHYNKETVKALEKENFLLGFTTLRGTNYLPTARRLELRRNHIASNATLSALQARLLYGARLLNGWHTLRKKGPFRKNTKGYES